LEGIIRFGGETVKEVMTSRLDMVDLDVRTPFKDRNFSFVRQFQCMRKFIHRNIMILLGKVLIQKSGRTQL